MAGVPAGAMGKVLETQMVHAAQLIEQQLDSEITRLENLKDDDLERLREKRLKQLKDHSRLKDEWLANGHGKYSEIASEKDFFEESKKSKNIVCHFYRESTFRCKIVDKHLTILAPRHLECKFMKISVEKAPFLCQRLKIRMLPTVAMVKDEKFKDYIVGFDELGGHDEFSTEMMEWRIAQADVLDYKGDLMNPPDETGKNQAPGMLAVNKKSKKIIRGGDNGGSSSDEYDW